MKANHAIVYAEVFLHEAAHTDSRKAGLRVVDFFRAFRTLRVALRSNDC